MALVSYAKSISDIAQQAARKATKQGITCERMCDTCAFKWNQPHTLEYFLAADQAAGALMSGAQFNCHTQDFKDAGTPCKAFELVKKMFGDEGFEEGK